MLEFVSIIHDLPRGGGEVARVFFCDAVAGGAFDFEGDGLKIMRFLFGNLIFCDGLAGEGVPEKAFDSLFSCPDSLPTGDELIDFNGTICDGLRKFHRGIIQKNRRFLKRRFDFVGLLLEI